MKKLLVGVTAVVASVTCFALDVNVWTGASGNFLWSDMGNWKKQDGGDPIDISKTSNVSAPVWDFSALPADATVTNDYEGTFYMSGLTFAANQGTITFVSLKSTQQCSFVKSNADPWINPVVSIPTGTTIDFKARYYGDWNQSYVYFKNGGTFRINGDWNHATILRLFVNDATLVVGKDWPAASGASFTYVFLNNNAAVFELEEDRMLGQVTTSAGLTGKPKMYLNGHTLTMRIPNDNSHGITNAAEIVTGGTIAMRYNYANALTGGFAEGCTPMTFSMDNADLDLGGVDNPVSAPSGSKFVGNRNGRLGLYGDQSFASVKSDSSAGGLSIAKDKTFTVTGTADTTETLKAPIVGGGKVTVKAPASYELKLTGANTFAQNFRVESGKVSTARPYRDAEGLVAYWNFDNDVTGSDPRSVTPGKIVGTGSYSATTRPSFDGTGVGDCGKCAHFAYSGASSYGSAVADKDLVRQSITVKVKGVDDARLQAMEYDHTVVMYIRPDLSEMVANSARTNASGRPVMEIFYNCWPNEEDSTEYGMLWLSFQDTNMLNVAGLNVNRTGAFGRDLTKYGIDCFDGAWHQLAVSFDSETKTHRLYVDGQNLYTRERGPDERPYRFILREDFRFGARVTHNRGFDQVYCGDMDNLQLWNRVLTPAEIADDWRRLGNVAGGDAFGKTAPVAHWKFDDSADIGKDSTGNGNSLEVVTGTGWGIKLKDSSLCPGVNGTAVQIPTLNGSAGSHLVGDLPSAFSYTNSFSVTIRLQRIGGNDENLNAAFFIGSAESEKFLEVHFKNWLPYLEATVFGWGYTGDTVNQVASSPANMTGSRSGWMDFAFVYDKPNQSLKIYRDGILVNSWAYYPSNSNFSFGSDPKIYVGYSPMKNGWFPEYVDDMRLYDRALTAAEVSEITRELSADGRASDNVLPSKTVVSLVNTGVLDIGANQTISALWGAAQGTLSLPWANLTVTDSCDFGGVLSGRGTIFAKSPFSLVGSGPDFYGKVVAEKSFSVNDKFPNATFAMPEGVQITRVGNETDPYFAATSGAVEIPATGSLTVTGTDYPKDGRIVLARGTAVSAPDGFEGWTVTLPGGKSGRFYVKGGDFGFKVHGGMLLLIK